jgi:hypothetical protein
MVCWHLAGQTLYGDRALHTGTCVSCIAACLLLLTLLRLPLPHADAVAAVVVFALQKVMPS